jgi:2-keto-3-deoxy-L-rhamnonate aldolase RhmA
VQRVIEVAKSNGQHAGIFVSGPEEAARRWKQGFNLNPTGSEVFLLNAGVNRLLAELRQALSS